MAAYTDKFAESKDIQGNDNAQGTIHFAALATGKLANLSNTNAIFKVQHNLTGSYISQAWEQK